MLKQYDLFFIEAVDLFVVKYENHCNPSDISHEVIKAFLYATYNDLCAGVPVSYIFYIFATTNLKV